jgi:hypothetical protein
MAQFGADPALAAHCPTAPTPDGWKEWTDADGPIPDALVKRAQALVDDSTVPLGATESYPLPGVTALIRVEPRVWSRDAQGNLQQGCFRSAGIFLPSGEAPVTPPATDGTSKLVGWLTAASLAVGIGATIFSMGDGGK